MSNEQSNEEKHKCLRCGGTNNFQAIGFRAGVRICFFCGFVGTGRDIDDLVRATDDDLWGKIPEDSDE